MGCGASAPRESRENDVSKPPVHVFQVESIRDTKNSDARLAAERSQKIQNPVAKIEVAVGTFKDQGWGNCKGNLYLTLLEGDTVLACRNLYGTYRSNGYQHGPQPPPLTLSDSEDVVRLAKPGCFYRMEYTVGAGGGHVLEVQNWTCAIYECEPPPEPTVHVVQVKEIRDRKNTDSRQTAESSKKIRHPVGKIEVAVGTFKDQGWGNCKGNLYLTLLEGDTVLACRNLYGTYRTNGYQHGPQPPPLTLSGSEDVVRLAKPGCCYRMEYTVGAGGGHVLVVENWTCTIHERKQPEPSTEPTNEPSNELSNEPSNEPGN